MPELPLPQPALQCSAERIPLRSPRFAVRESAATSEVFRVGSEAAQVAVVDADQRGRELESEVELGGFADFGGTPSERDRSVSSRAFAPA